MVTAAREFRKKLAETTFMEPKIDVLSNYSGEYHPADTINGGLSMKNLLLTFILTASFVSRAGAVTPKKSYEGCYVPINGNIRMMSTLPAKHQGTISAFFLHTHWADLPPADKKRIHRALHLRKGVLSAEMIGQTKEGIILESHIFTNRTRDGMLATMEDEFIPDPDSFDCVDFDPSGVPVPGIVSGTEIVHPTVGKGVFSGLNPEASWLVFYGTVNLCAGDEDYGKYDFVLTPGEGQLCFEPVAEPAD